MKTITLRGIHTKTELMACLKKELGLPDYFSGNFDSLEECLLDLPQTTDIIIDTTGFNLELKSDDAIAKAVLQSVNVHWQEIGSLMAVI